MKITLDTIYGLLLALFMLFMLYQYAFQWKNLPDLTGLLG
jgi:Fe2+ transport system protein B